MSRFQIPYNQARKKESIAAVPQILQDIKKWEEIKRTATDNFSKKAADARIKALKIKMTSYKKGDPVKESLVKEHVDFWCPDCEKNEEQQIENPDDCFYFSTDECPYQDKIENWEEQSRAEAAELNDNPKDIDDSLPEASQGAVTTGNVGSSTMSTSDGGTVPAAFGSSHIYASSMGMFKRRGYTPPKKFLPKKKKKIREFIEYYFDKE